MIALTEKEKVIYDYIIATIRQEGYSPSVRDIRVALDIKSTSTVHKYLSSLESKGYIQKEQGKSRTLRVEQPESRMGSTLKVPLLGQVTAGTPILAVENHEGYIDFPVMGKSYLRNHLFALHVRGESMIEAGIMDGDLIIVEKTNYAENGTIVVAMIGDEATVKTFYKENGHYRLQPENDTMDPIIVNEVEILGKVVGVFRKL